MSEALELHPRVAEALERVGLVLVQGQHALPSLADLLAGHPVTTRGYSWDYVPAWTLREELDAHPDFAHIKLWNGRSTIVARRHWPAVESLARAARARFERPHELGIEVELLLLIESDPGITGKQIQSTLRWDGKTFQKHKRFLEDRLLILGRDQEALESHTHDQGWFPWREGKIARAMRSRKRLPMVEDAANSLLTAAGLSISELSEKQRQRFLPVL